MILYHGTSVGGLSELKPHLSEHGKPYVYFSTNPVVAAFYTVHIVERPYSWFPYGFDRDGTPVHTEYYENALADVYDHKTGYLYRCGAVKDAGNPTKINCAYVCEKPVRVDSVLGIENVYGWFLEQEQKGALRIVRHHALTADRRRFAGKIAADEIDAYRLRDHPDSSYSKFISDRFPEIWNKK